MNTTKVCHKIGSVTHTKESMLKKHRLPIKVWKTSSSVLKLKAKEAECKMKIHTNNIDIENFSLQGLCTVEHTVSLHRTIQLVLENWCAWKISHGKAEANWEFPPRSFIKLFNLTVKLWQIYLKITKILRWVRYILGNRPHLFSLHGCWFSLLLFSPADPTFLKKDFRKFLS